MKGTRLNQAAFKVLKPASRQADGSQAVVAETAVAAETGRRHPIFEARLKSIGGASYDPMFDSLSAITV